MCPSIQSRLLTFYGSRTNTSEDDHELILKRLHNANSCIRGWGATTYRCSCTREITRLNKCHVVVSRRRSQLVSTPDNKERPLPSADWTSLQKKKTWDRANAQECVRSSDVVYPGFRLLPPLSIHPMLPSPCPPTPTPWKHPLSSLTLLIDVSAYSCHIHLIRPDRGWGFWGWEGGGGLTWGGQGVFVGR